MTAGPSLLFSPLRIGRVTVPNRIVFPAHFTGFARAHRPTERHARYYAERARGGAGLIVTEITAVHPASTSFERVVWGFDPELLGPPPEPGLPAWIAAHSVAVAVVKGRRRRNPGPEPRVVAIGFPRPRSKRIFTPSSDLPAEERIRLLLLGGVKAKQAEVVEGSAESVADQLLQFLLQHGRAPEEVDA